MNKKNNAIYLKILKIVKIQFHCLRINIIYFHNSGAIPSQSF